MRRSRTDSDRRQRVRAYHKHATWEHSRYPEYNLGYLTKVGAFDAFKVSRDLAKQGAAVTLAFMKDDLLFFDIARFYFVNEMSEHGIAVCLDIPGEHDEFLFYPVQLLKTLTSQTDNSLDV